MFIRSHAVDIAIDSNKERIPLILDLSNTTFSIFKSKDRNKGALSGS